MKNGLLSALEQPSRADFLRPERYYQAQRQRIEEAAIPLLSAASQAAAERVRRIEAEKRRDEARKRLSDADSRAEARFDGMVEQRVFEFRLEMESRIRSLQSRMSRMDQDHAREEVAREKAEQRTRKAEERVKEAERRAAKAEAMLTEVRARINSISQTLKRELGNAFAAINEKISRDWANHPQNPACPEPEDDEPSPYSSGPSI